MVRIIRQTAVAAAMLVAFAGPAWAEQTGKRDEVVYTECSGHCMSDAVVMQAAQPARAAKPVAGSENKAAGQTPPTMPLAAVGK